MIGAIDLGGTTTRFAVFDSHDDRVPIRRHDIGTASDYAGFLEMCAEERREWPEIEALGVSFGVQFDNSGRRVVAASKDPSFVGKDMAGDMEKLFGTRVRLAHDCVCALLAEANSRRAASAYVTISTGVGAAVLLQTDRGAVAFRSRWAHSIIDYDGRTCACGQTGCLAAYVDSGQLSLRTRTELPEIADSGFWEGVARQIAAGLVSLSWVLPLSEIIVGGGMVLKNECLRRELPSFFEEMRQSEGRPECRMRYPTLGAESPLVGAMMLALDQDTQILYQGG